MLASMNQQWRYIRNLYALCTKTFKQTEFQMDTSNPHMLQCLANWSKRRCGMLLIIVMFFEESLIHAGSYVFIPPVKLFEVLGSSVIQRFLLSFVLSRNIYATMSATEHNLSPCVMYWHYWGFIVLFFSIVQRHVMFELLHAFNMLHKFPTLT